MRGDLKQDGGSKISFAGPEEREEELPLRHHGLFTECMWLRQVLLRLHFPCRTGRENVAFCGP